MTKTFLFFALIIIAFEGLAQTDQMFEAFDDDLNVGGDIFSDFNEDLETSQVLEDERFYRYSRFFCVNLGLGATFLTGNRGDAFEDNHPSYNFSVTYFNNFQAAIVLGLEYSKHTMVVDTYVKGYPSQIIGAVETSFLRPYLGFRYYIDTSDLGTAITYSNPYLVGRMEYWYQTNSFPDVDNLSKKSGGGLGTGIGGGLEFPIVLKDRYLGVELLYHKVNFFDKDNTDYQSVPDGSHGTRDQRAEDSNHKKLSTKSDWGNYPDLRGNVITLMFNYVINW